MPVHEGKIQLRRGGWHGARVRARPPGAAAGFARLGGQAGFSCLTSRLANMRKAAAAAISPHATALSLDFRASRAPVTRLLLGGQSGRERCIGLRLLLQGLDDLVVPRRTSAGHHVVREQNRHAQGDERTGDQAPGPAIDGCLRAHDGAAPGNGQSALAWPIRHRGARRVASRAVQTFPAHGPHLLDRAIRAGFGTEAAIQFFIRRDGDAAAGQPRAPGQQAAIGAQVAAIGPSHEHARHQESPAEQEHVRRARSPEETHERVEPADQKIAGQRRLHGEEDRQPQIDVLQQAQRPVQPARHLDRLQHHQFLNRAQRANASAEGAAEKQGHDQRQKKVAVTTMGMEYLGSASATATFWSEPMGQMQPSR